MLTVNITEYQIHNQDIPKSYIFQTLCVLLYGLGDKHGTGSKKVAGSILSSV